MLSLNKIVGDAASPQISERLHQLDHHGLVERIILSETDRLRKRLRVSTDKGTDCAITLDRSTQLESGSVLLLSDERAVIVQLDEIQWMVLEADSTEAAIEMGFLAGHLHWRVKFDGPYLLVAMERPENVYKDRLSTQLEQGKICITGYR